MSVAGQGPLHAMDPTGRFSDRADDYAAFRPAYPRAAVDAVLDGLGDPASLVAADVGAGTGIFSRLLGDRGVRVVAVEPNASMRDAARAHPRVEWRAGTGEATGLDGASVGLVTCAQAFHWFRAEEALAEFARVLPAGGRLALAWNERTDGSAFARGYNRLIREASGHHPAERRVEHADALERSRRFVGARRLVVEWVDRLGAPGVVGRAFSASYIPRRGPESERLRQDLLALQAREAEPDGRVSMTYACVVWLAERA